MSMPSQAAITQIDKDIKSALCYIPPSHHWDKIQEIRCYNDKGFVRWPPHINLLYPFWKNENSNYDEAIPILQEVTSKYEPIKIQLNKITYFERGNYIRVSLESSSPPSELIQLQEDIFKAFPDCYHLNKNFKHNLSLPLGQWKNKDEAFDFISRIKDTIDIITSIEQLSIISRPDFSTPFQISRIIKLGKDRINLKSEINYVCTLSSDEIRSKGYQSYYGIGEEEKESIWCFGYGSNMSPDNIVNKAIKPIESIPGILYNYRLKFNIFGAYANVEDSGDTDLENGNNIPNCVHGLLHKFSHNDFSKLTNVERLYFPLEVMVKTYNDGLDIRAIVYTAAPQMKLKNPYLRPRHNYMKFLTDGGKYWGLNTDYVKWLESLDTNDISDLNLLDPEYFENDKGEKINVFLRRVGAWNSTYWKSVMKDLGIEE